MNDALLYTCLGAIPALTLALLYLVARHSASPGAARIRAMQTALESGRASAHIELSALAYPSMREMAKLANRAIANYQSLRGHQRIINYIALVSETDNAGNITFVNETFCRVSGYPRDEILGQSHRILKSGRHGQEFYRDMWETIACGRVWRGDICNRNYNGSDYWVSTVIAPIQDQDGRVIKYLSVGFDITARVNADIALIAEKERWRVTLDSVGEGVIVTDADGLIEFMNPKAENLLDVMEQQARGVPLDEIFVVHVDGNRTASHHTCVQGGEGGHEDDQVLYTAAGRGIPVQSSSAPIRADDGSIRGCVMVFRDSSERHSMMEELRWQAFHDPLTGLPNRRAIEDAIRGCLDDMPEHGNVGVFCYIDLDNFKLVNDTCGHAVGDQLIKEIARVMQDAIAHMHLLARLGGDEFGLLIKRATLSEALRILDTLVLSIQGHRFRHGELAFKSSASVGVSIIDGTASVSEVIARADTACFSAKQAGRRQVQVYNADGHNNIAAEMQWVGRFEESFTNGRFRLYRQRIAPIAHHNGRDHYEILLRHHRADGKVEPPGLFLPAAERYGMATVFDAWVVRTLFAYLSSNRDDTADYSINLSGATLSDPSFLRGLAELIEYTPVDPKRLTFEVTETAMVHNMARAMDMMKAILDYGCIFSLDDFGSGLSSFGYIKSMPVAVIKIDGAFIRNLVTDATDQAIVRAIATLGRDLGKKTVAEFVEDDATLDILRRIGVDYAQGYGIHKPEPIDHD